MAHNFFILVVTMIMTQLMESMEETSGIPSVKV